MGDVNDIVILGRAGNPPPTEAAAWLYETINFTSDDTDWWTYANPFGWTSWAGSAIDLDHDLAFIITVEFRSAAEVAAAGGGGHPFAVNNFAGAPGFPAMDGAQMDGSPTPTFDRRRVIRILIREDLASGGAGQQWSGRAFLTESLVHELGHVALLMLIDLYGEEYVVQTLSEIFGRPESAWNSESIPWEDRTIECVAEAFKDVAFPLRRYDSRTTYKLPRARLADFTELMFDYLQFPYWRAQNTFPMTVREDQFFNNLGATSRVRDANIAEVFFRPPSITSSQPPATLAGIYEWPPRGSMELHWNYNWAPAPDFGVAWDDLVFVDFNPPGEPGTFCKINLGIVWVGYGGSEQFFASDFNPFLRDEFDNAPPIAGDMTLFPTDDGGLLGSAPEEGVRALIGFEGNGPVPKADLWEFDGPHFPGEWFDNRIGMPYTWPWVDWSLKAARGLVIQIPWPYPRRLMGVVRLGPVQDGRVELDRSYLGRRDTAENV